MRRTLLAALMACLLMPAVAAAQGFLARKATALEDLVLGTDESGYGMSQTEYQMQTGTAYTLKIISTGRKEYAFEAPEFFNFVWLRKIEAGGVEIKVTHVYELEFEDEGELELYFLPIRPGTYTFRARGLEDKGMVGAFVVK